MSARLDGLSTKKKQEMSERTINAFRQSSHHLLLFERDESSSRVAGREAIFSFLNRVDSEDWWLGNVALVFNDASGQWTVAIVPEEDGDALDVFAWGHAADELVTKALNDAGWNVDRPGRA